jgi:hypothetical protein
MTLLTNAKNDDVVIIANKVETIQVVGRTIVFGMDSKETRRWHFSEEGELDLTLKYVMEMLQNLAE